MPATVLQTINTPVQAGGSVEVPSAPFAADSIVVVTVVYLGAYGATPDDPTLFLDGIVSTPSFTAFVGGIWTAMLRPSDAGGASSLRIVPATGGSWTTLVVEVGGAAIVESDIRNGTTPSAGGFTPTTPSWSPVDVGIEMVVMIARPVSGSQWDPPAGWTAVHGGSSGDIQWSLVQRAIPAPGFEVGDAWTWSGVTPPAVTLYATTLFPFYDIGLRVGASIGSARSTSASIATPGPWPEPPETIPFFPGENPMPPDADEIVVPLPPWVPGPGPFRTERHQPFAAEGED